ncbi:MAG: pseudouridine synthase [Cyclobacteriaceae bacterium]
MKRVNKYFIIHKPFKVLSQFSDENGNLGLGSIFDLPKDVYPVGRLDLDSEGLLILTNDKSLNNKLLNPVNKHERVYLAEIEGVPDESALTEFRNGLEININGKKHKTLPAVVRIVTNPELKERNPPVNYKKHPVRSWVEIKLTEGKNRQVRKMTAAIGHPTLRLLRIGVEDVNLFPLQSGEITQMSEKVIYKKLKL